MSVPNQTLPPGNSAMAQNIREFDWAATPLGPIEHWPERFRALVELMLDSSAMTAILWGPDALQLYNDAFAACMSDRHPEALGRSAFAAWGDAQDVFAPLWERAWSGEPVTERNVAIDFSPGLTCADGRFDLTFTPMRNERAEVIAIYGVVTETTERVLTEGALRFSEERYRSLFESIDEGYALYEPIYDERGEMIDVKIIEVNPAYKRLTHRADPSGKTLNQVSPGLDPLWADAMSQVIRSGQPQRFERHNLGIDRWFDVFISLVSDDARPRVALILNDITERKRAENALRDSEERFRSLFESIDEGYALYELLCDAAGQPNDAVIRAVNPAYAALMKRPNPVGKALSEFGGDLVIEWIQVMASVIASGVPERLERYNPILERWFDVYVAPAPGAVPNHVMLVFSDITDRKRATEALLRSEERYRTLFDSIDQGFCTIEVFFDDARRPVDYQFLEINPAFERTSGLENAIGKRMRELAPAHEEYWFQLYGKVARTREPARFEAEAAALGRWYNVYAYPIGEPEDNRVAVLFEDVTERHLAHASLVESELRYRTLIQNLPDYAIFLLDPRWPHHRMVGGRRTHHRFYE